MTTSPRRHALRHGSTGFIGFRGRLDDPLNHEGWDQMQHALGSQRWDRIVTSPRKRCSFFAQHLAHEWQVPLVVDPLVAELDFGDWEGLTVAEVFEQAPLELERFWADPWSFPPPHGEPMDHFSHRVGRAWTNICAHGEATLLITHGGVIRLLHHRLTGSSRDRLLHYPVPQGSLHDLAF